MKSIECSRLAHPRPTAPTVAQAPHRAAALSVGGGPAAQTAPQATGSDTAHATLGVPVPGHAAGGLAMAPGTSEADMPLWVLLLALAALVLPAMVSLRLVARWIGRLTNRWPPLRALGVILLAVLAGVASYSVTRRNLHARAETAPRSTPLVLPSNSTTALGQSMPQSATKPEAEPSAPFPGTPAGHAAFVRTMVSVLRRKGLTHRQALLFAAHLARETGWGRWVRGNNFGNVKKGRGWSGPTFIMRDARGFVGEYRAWPTLEQGVESNLALVRESGRYRKAWKLLRAGDVRWYGQLGLDGYYEGPTGHAHDGSRFHTEHDLSTVLNVQREYEGIVALATQYDGGDA